MDIIFTSLSFSNIYKRMIVIILNFVYIYIFVIKYASVCDCHSQVCLYKHISHNDSDISLIIYIIFIFICIYLL